MNLTCKQFQDTQKINKTQRPYQVISSCCLLSFLYKIQKRAMFFITCTCVVDVGQGCSKGSALAIDKDMCPRYCCSPLSYKPKNRLCFGSQ